MKRSVLIQNKGGEIVQEVQDFAQFFDPQKTTETATGAELGTDKETAQKKPILKTAKAWGKAAIYRL